MHDGEEGPPALLEPLRIDIDLRSVPRAVYGSAERRLPFPLWLTIEQVRSVAEDAELRAGMMTLWSTHAAMSGEADRTVHLLSEVAHDLRMLVDRLADAQDGR